jgi:hypothetical protein
MTIRYGGRLSAAFVCSLAGGTMLSFPDLPAFVIANFALVQPETIFDGSFEH